MATLGRRGARFERQFGQIAGHHPDGRRRAPSARTTNRHPVRSQTATSTGPRRTFQGAITAAGKDLAARPHPRPPDLPQDQSGPIPPILILAVNSDTLPPDHGRRLRRQFPGPSRCRRSPAVAQVGDRRGFPSQRSAVPRSIRPSSRRPGINARGSSRRARHTPPPTPPRETINLPKTSFTNRDQRPAHRRRRLLTTVVLAYHNGAAAPGARRPARRCWGADLTGRSPPSRIRDSRHPADHLSSSPGANVHRGPSTRIKAGSCRGPDLQPYTARQSTSTNPARPHPPRSAPFRARTSRPRSY